jgi:hypothetical protein
MCRGSAAINFRKSFLFLQIEDRGSRSSENTDRNQEWGLRSRWKIGIEINPDLGWRLRSRIVIEIKSEDSDPRLRSWIEIKIEDKD